MTITPSDYGTVNTWFDATTATVVGGAVTAVDDLATSTPYIVNGSLTVDPSGALLFDGSAWIEGARRTAPLPAEQHVFIVTRPDDVSSFRGIFSDGSWSPSDNIYVRALNASASTTSWDVRQTSGGTYGLTSAPGLGSFSLLEVIISGGQMLLAVNGVEGASPVTVSPANSISDVGRLTIGAYTTTFGVQAPWEGAIGEVIQYDSTLASLDATEVRTYLANKWNILVSGVDYTPDVTLVEGLNEVNLGSFAPDTAGSYTITDSNGVLLFQDGTSTPISTWTPDVDGNNVNVILNVGDAPLSGYITLTDTTTSAETLIFYSGFAVTLVTGLEASIGENVVDITSYIDPGQAPFTAVLEFATGTALVSSAEGSTYLTVNLVSSDNPDVFSVLMTGTSETYRFVFDIVIPPPPVELRTGFFVADTVATRVPLGDGDIPVLINNDTVTVYFGATDDLTVDNGMPLNPNFAYEFQKTLADAGWEGLWVISATAGVEIRYGTVG